MKVFAFGLVFCLTVLHSATLVAKPMYGVFMIVKGTVMIYSNGGAPKRANVGSRVIEGDKIVSQAESRAKIVMADRNVISLSPNTTLILRKYQNHAPSDTRNVELELSRGKIRTSVYQRYDGKQNRFRVKTPTAVAGVRGTDFLTSYSPVTKATQVITFEGLVEVTHFSSAGDILEGVSVRPGQTTSIKEGSAPEPPTVVPEKTMLEIDEESKGETSVPEKKDSVQNAPAPDKKERQPTAVAAGASGAAGSLLTPEDLEPSKVVALPEKTPMNPTPGGLSGPLPSVPQTGLPPLPPVEQVNELLQNQNQLSTVDVIVETPQ